MLSMSINKIEYILIIYVSIDLFYRCLAHSCLAYASMKGKGKRCANTVEFYL